MSNTTIYQAKAPGKMFLAGEYAVVESGQTAILTTVDAFLTVTIKKSGGEVGILTTNQGKHPISWKYGENFTIFSTTPHKEDYSLIRKTVETVMCYSAACGAPRESWRQYFNIDIKSELDHPNGQKYGLGSSAAVTVAIIDALLQFYQLTDYTPRERKQLVYKLAVIAQSHLNMAGSYGDLAAVSFTGMNFYQNFDRSWFVAQAKTTGAEIKALAERAWPGLIIRPLQPNPDWTLSVIWSETPASTEKLLQALPEPSASQRGRFLNQSNQQVQLIQQAIVADDYPLLVQGLQANFNSILDYTRSLGRPYMTPSFTAAQTVAASQQTFIKISGAGAGDCAYSISADAAGAHRLQTTWRENDLVVLPLNFWSDGEECYHE